MIKYELKRVPSAKVSSAQVKPLCCGFEIGYRWVQASSSVGGFVGTFLLINAASIMMEVQIALRAQWQFLAPELVLHTATVAVMFLTALTNPGIIPQRVPGYEMDEQHFLIPEAEAPSANYLLTTLNLLPLTKYCNECRIYRPVRTIHCGVCNHCVEGFDHHCPWVSVCIGKRNYKFFLAFMMLTMALTSYSSAIAIYQFVDSYSGSFLAALGNNVLGAIVLVLAVWFFGSLLVLCVYHMKILTKGLTTNEDLKQTYETIPHKRPFKKASTLKRKNISPFAKDYYLCKNPVKYRDSGLSGFNAAAPFEMEMLETQKNSIHNSLLVQTTNR